MKLEITQNTFMKYWNMAIGTTGSNSPMPSLANVLCEATEEGVFLSATDLKTAVKIQAQGATVMEPGTAILPVKVVGELIKRISVSPFTIEVGNNEKGSIHAGRSHYTFTTYNVTDFPNLPSPKAAEEFAKVQIGELSRILAEGCIAGAPNEEFPKYLSGGFVQIKNGEFRVVSTDGRRLSLSKMVMADADSSSPEKAMLLPLKSLEEYQKILNSSQPDQEVEILEDNALAYFNVPGISYSVRCIDSKFPNYERILKDTSTTQLRINKQEFIKALDRVKVVSGIVVLKLSPGAALELTARAPEVGEADESVDATISGEPLKVGFNINYLMSGVKAFRGEEVFLSFDGTEGQMNMTHPDGSDFLYMLMPIKLSSIVMSEGK